MKPMDKLWSAALAVAFRQESTPKIGFISDPHEHFRAEVTSRALVLLKFKDSKAHDLARAHRGTPRERLIRIFNGVKI